MPKNTDTLNLSLCFYNIGFEEYKSKDLFL